MSINSVLPQAIRERCLRQMPDIENQVFGRIWQLGPSLKDDSDLEWGRHHAQDDLALYHRAVCEVAHQVFDNLSQLQKDFVSGRLWHYAKGPEEWEWGKHHAKDPDKVDFLLEGLLELRQNEHHDPLSHRTTGSTSSTSIFYKIRHIVKRFFYCSLPRNAGLGEEVFSLQEGLKMMPLDIQHAVFRHVWELAGSPMDDHDPEWGQTHAYDDRERLSYAIATVSDAKIHAITDKAHADFFAERFIHHMENPSDVEKAWNSKNNEQKALIYLKSLGDLYVKIKSQNNQENQSLLSRMFARLFGTKKNIISGEEREHRLHKTDSEIQTSLHEEMKRCQRQKMEQKQHRHFRLEEAPISWVIHNQKASPQYESVLVESSNVGSKEIAISHMRGSYSQKIENTHIATQFTLYINGRFYPVELFGICEGYKGRSAAEFVQERFQHKIEETLKEFNKEGLSDAGIWRALKIAFVRLNKEFQQKNICSGTNATIAMILEENLWTANVGIGRAVLNNQGKAELLSCDAIPSDPRYENGIKKRGGKVVTKHGTSLVNGSLLSARSIGSHKIQQGISARPKITKKSLSEIQKGSHLMLCSHGFSTIASTNQIVDAMQRSGALSLNQLLKNILYSACRNMVAHSLSAIVIKM